MDDLAEDYADKLVEELQFLSSQTADLKKLMVAESKNEWKLWISQSVNPILFLNKADTDIWNVAYGLNKKKERHFLRLLSSFWIVWRGLLTAK